MNWDIIKCPQLFTQILRKNDSGEASTKLSLHRISDSQKYSFFLSQEPRIFCFRNYRVCGTNYPLGTYHSKSEWFSYNLYMTRIQWKSCLIYRKSVSIVEYQIHQYNTHNSYALTISVTTYFDGPNNINGPWDYSKSQSKSFKLYLMSLLSMNLGSIVAEIGVFVLWSYMI